MQICSFGSRSSIPVNILVCVRLQIYVRFVLSAKFHKGQAHCNFETKSPQVFNFRSGSAISNIFMINELDLLWLPNLQHWEYISFLGPNFLGMRGLILVLMSNVCYLAVILIFLVVAWWLLLVTGGYCSLPLVIARSYF